MANTRRTQSAEALEFKKVVYHKGHLEKAQIWPVS